MMSDSTTLTTATTEREVWRDIDGYDGLYQVSNMGRVRSCKYGKWKVLKPATINKGYFFVNLWRNGEGKHYLVHRLVAEAFIPNPDDKPQVNHINGVKNDNREVNLAWCTSSENRQHAYDAGLNKSGEDNITTKLLNADVEWIREHYKPYDPEFGACALARRFNVSHGTILNIVKGRTYARVGGVISEKYRHRKLTDEQVRYIREYYIRGDREFGGCALACKFGVDPATIRNIVHGKIYRDVQ